MNRRIVGLVLALVLAGVATFSLLVWVRAADDRAREGEELAQVFRAQGDIPAGTSIEAASGQALIGTDEIPRRLVPEGAVGSLDSLAGRVATTGIGDGEILVAHRFGTTVAQPGARLSIPEGMEAVSLEATIVPGVAGYVQPQDRVSLVATVDVTEKPELVTDEDGEPAGFAEGEGTLTKYIVHDVVVLAIGQRLTDTEGEGEGEARVEQSTERYVFTLAMLPEDIEKAVFASHTDYDLWFTLLPPLAEGEEREPVTTDGVHTANIYND